MRRLSGIFAVTFLLFLFISVVSASAQPPFLYKFGTFGTGDGQFDLPFSMAIDGSGNIYVVDAGNARIQVFDSSGVYQSQFGTSGTGDGQFSLPQGIALDSSGNKYVTDSGLDRVQVFNSSGVYQSQFGTSGTGEGQFSLPFGIAVDSSGNIYVADSGNARIQVFDSTGVFQSQFGTYGTGDGQFLFPAGIALDGSGNIYVSDTGESRIQVFGPVPFPPVVAGFNNSNKLQLYKNKKNKIKVENLQPYNKIKVIWGFKKGNGKVNSGNCPGTELGIKPFQAIATLKANSSGNLNKTFYVPSTSAKKAYLHILNLADCSVGELTEVRLLN